MASRYAARQSRPLAQRGDAAIAHDRRPIEHAVGQVEFVRREQHQTSSAGERAQALAQDARPTRRPGR